MDPYEYVILVKYSIVLTKLRNSTKMSRAITYHQLKQLKPKNLLPLLLKYRDFALATVLVEMLRLDKLNVVYEEWCIQMLRYSTQSEPTLIDKFREKFENLAAKVAIDQGYSFSAIQSYQNAAREASMSGL
jgi:hypothetical protein